MAANHKSGPVAAGIKCITETTTTMVHRLKRRTRHAGRRSALLIQAAAASKGHKHFLTLPTAEAGGFFLTKECSCFTEDRLPALGAGWSYTVSAG